MRQDRSLLLLVLALGLTLVGCIPDGLPKRRGKHSFEGPEARTWLRQNRNESALASNRFGPTSAAVSFVDRLYAAGAERVIVPSDCITEEDDGGPYADALVVKLPTDPSRRKEVFAICAREIKREGFDPEESTDGNWVFLWWD